MIRLQSGQSGGNQYHGATNVYENDDNDSITTLHNTLANLTHASNTNTTELKKKSSTASEMTALRTTVGQHAQQLANITTTPTVTTTAWVSPPEKKQQRCQPTYTSNPPTVLQTHMHPPLQPTLHQHSPPLATAGISPPPNASG